MKRAALICFLFCVVTTSLGVNTNDVARDHYHPAAVQKPRLIEQFDKRFDDGHYEYSYSLSNGDKRYEHAYWQPVGNNNVLARKGYYSYPLPNNKYLTVFYTSDQNGFQQDFSSYSSAQPNLPRTIEIPQQVPMKAKPVYAAPHVSSTPAPPPVYVMTQPQAEHAYVSHVASTPPPSYIITSGGHYAWDQSNRLKRQVSAQQPTSQRTESTTTRRVSTTTPIPVSTTRASSTIPFSSTSSVQIGQPGLSQSSSIGIATQNQLQLGLPQVATSVHTQTQTIRPSSQPQTNVNNQAYQNALINYLVSRVSSESLDSSSSESREYYLSGLSRPRHGSGSHHRRSGNRPIWNNQQTQQTLTTYGF